MMRCLCCIVLAYLCLAGWSTTVVDATVAERCANSSLASKVNRNLDPERLDNPSRNSTDCSLEDNVYSADYCIAAAVLLGVGFIFCFFGARVFKLILFLTGFIVAGGMTFFVLYEHLPCSVPEFSWVVIGTAAGVGLLIGILTVCVYYVGIFAIGAAGGALAMLGFLSYLNISYLEHHNWLPIVLVIIVALICGLIALKLQEKLIAIPATALIGAILLMYGLDYFVENTVAVKYSFDLLQAKAERPSCVQTWIMLGLWPFVFGAGILIQCIRGGKDKDKDKSDGGQEGSELREQRVRLTDDYD